MKRVLLLLLLLAASGWCEPELKVEVLRQGRGPEIRSGQEAQVGYILTLESGKLIDQATAMRPFRFKIGSNDVIPGFSQAVSGMKVGEMRQVLIPPELGYGDREVGTIPPGSTLVYQIELYGIGGQAHDDHDAAENDHDHDHIAHPHEDGHADHDGHDHPPVESAQEHDHDHDHGDRDLSEAFQDEDFLANRNARDITRPAMYEYLLREFYTKPWRYEDGYKKVGLSSLKVFGALLLLIGFSWIATRKGYLSK